MKKKEILTAINTYAKGTFGINVVVKESLNKKLVNPFYNLYFNRLEKVTLVTNVRFGCSYKGTTNAKLKALGKPSDYSPSSMKGMRWEIYPYIKQSIKTNLEYLSFVYRLDGKTKFTNKYLLDGKEISYNDFCKIVSEGWIKLNNTYCKKQAQKGIVNEEEQTKVLNYRFDFIKSINKDKEEAIKVFNSL